MRDRAEELPVTIQTDKPSCQHLAAEFLLCICWISNCTIQSCICFSFIICWSASLQHFKCYKWIIDNSKRILIILSKLTVNLFLSVLKIICYRRGVISDIQPNRRGESHSPEPCACPCLQSVLPRGALWEANAGTNSLGRRQPRCPGMVCTSLQVKNGTWHLSRAELQHPSGILRLERAAVLCSLCGFLITCDCRSFGSNCFNWKSQQPQWMSVREECTRESPGKSKGALEW